MISNNISIILGVKVRYLRSVSRLTLKELSGKSGISTAYLNEIEKGKKYPKADKLLSLSKALDTSYDDLVSLKLGDELSAFEKVLNSPLLKKFPFHLFGLNAFDLIDMMAGHPRETGTLARMFEELGRNYDMRVEHFYKTALRSYQVLNRNYFPDLEAAAIAFRKSQGWDSMYCPTFEDLWRVLQTEHDVVAYEPREKDQLNGFRAIYVPKVSGMYFDPDLTSREKAFLAGRELGCRILGLEERSFSSPSLREESFEEVINNFRASYFADAVLVPEKRIKADMKKLFKMSKWNEAAFRTMLDNYHVTPEMLFYRMSELIPRHFKTGRIHFLKLHRGSGDRIRLEKRLNMSRVQVPNGLGLKEHFCRRWLSVGVLDDAEKAEDPNPVISLQRSTFINASSQFFCIAAGYPSTQKRDSYSSVTLGFQVNDNFKKTVKFWNDAMVPDRELGQTCERCPLTENQCKERIVPPSIFMKEQEAIMRKRELEEILQQV